MYGLTNDAGDEIALACCPCCGDAGVVDSDADGVATLDACSRCVRGHYVRAALDARHLGGTMASHLDEGVRDYLTESAEPEAA